MSVAEPLEADPATQREPVTRTPEQIRLSSALDLGWRVAELHARTDDLESPTGDGLLPAHNRLPRPDQLELQVRAASGDARRAGMGPAAEALDGLVEQARAVPDAADCGGSFRAALFDCHVALDKDLWARDEAAGKAYELGISLSDTYSRVARAYRKPGADGASICQEWREVFGSVRVEKIKKLLDDLQSRLDPSGVAVVAAQLDSWHDRVGKHLDDESEPPRLELVKDALRRQTVIWRQLLAGDKRPEAYLNRERRSQLQEELGKLVWRRYRRWAWLPAFVLFGVVLALLNFSDVSNWYQENIVTSGIGAALIAIVGAFGVTKASVALTLRTRVDQWSRLLWNRAMAQTVTDATLTADEVFQEHRAEGVAARIRAHAPGAATPPRAAGGRA